ncbi:MAG: YggS family pyridoxal phosphate-dependent enzyme [Actinomycetota bacterium]
MSAQRRNEIAQSLAEVRSQIPSHVTLIVVTKTFPISDVEILYELGERNFGENRDAEGAEKSQSIPDDAIWHFQGAVQSNKLRSILQWSDYIHSLDDLSHAAKISHLAQEMKKKQNCFIQINLDSEQKDETNRSGISPSEITTFAERSIQCEGLNIVGVMGVGPLNADPAPAFALLQRASHELQRTIPSATYISGGMSGDYDVAITYGATHVRIGSSILGSR